MWIQIFIIIFFLLACGTLFWKNKEHFWFLPQGTKLCQNVINLDRHQCKRCANAGYCTLPNGMKLCVPGDFNGPLNGQDCSEYEYGNDYANLSLIDPPQPYYVDTNKSWNWTKPIFQKKLYAQPYVETSSQYPYFRHNEDPLVHQRRL
jgi:hypothetical protein